ncbi:MAG: hypothetical protein Q8M29_16700 [Bacteroidota bacterium]|nr:hypothetical protein [Bacteroidota bacterium]
MLLILLAGTTYAQTVKVQQAYECVTQGKLDSAKLLIDVAITDPESAKDFQAWYIRGFIYKEIYKQKESSDFKSPARDVAVESLIKGLELDVEKQETPNMVQNLKFLGSKYNNDAIKTMDSVNYELSVLLFDKYISVYKICDPAFSEKSKRVEYYLALSYKFNVYFDQDTLDKHLAVAKLYLQQVLDLEPNSPMANKNYALLYYNMGVNIIKKMDYDVDLEQLYVLQEQATKLFKQAEPYMLKAHEVSPKDKTIVEGLQGIYYQLNDTEKSNEYKKKLDELNK